MGNSIGHNRIAQRASDVILANQVFELHRAPFTGQYDVTHGHGRSSRSVSKQPAPARRARILARRRTRLLGGRSNDGLASGKPWKRARSCGLLADLEEYACLELVCEAIHRLIAAFLKRVAILSNGLDVLLRNFGGGS